MFILPILPYNSFMPTQHLPIVSSPLSFSPIRPSTSPLSPRNANIPSRAYPMSSPIPEKTRNVKDNNSLARDRQNQDLPFANRKVKSNPLMERKGGDDGRETRRKLFLKRVRENSEDKRWKNRGGDDEIMRIIWVGEQRRREERQAREAQSNAEPEEDDSNLPEDTREISSSASKSQDEVMVDEVAQLEQEELEILIASMEPLNNQRMSFDNLPEMLHTPYGSDDEEYDSLFMEVISDETHFRESSLQFATAADNVETMDMS